MSISKEDSTSRCRLSRVDVGAGDGDGKENRPAAVLDVRAAIEEVSVLTFFARVSITGEDPSSSRCRFEVEVVEVDRRSGSALEKGA